jgi:hypothetical protein
MLSVVMAGRNDGYGYAPEARATHSINLYADALKGEGDEIIFVDDNSEEKTLPEVIWWELTEKARKMLRVLRITPDTHHRMRVRIPMAEYHAKNVGIRQAQNQWIMATNTDDFPIWNYAIFKQLRPGFYTTPSVIRIPVVDWTPCENRHDIWNVAQQIHERGIWKPGDFQLGDVGSWDRVRGYDEDLLDWGYNDSLLCQKAEFTFLPQNVLKIYHLEHKTAKAPARGWQHVKNHEQIPGLHKRTQTTNGPDWGTWDFEELRL